MNKQYYLAADCPNCGQKDAPNAWKGARMSAPVWGHNYPCCSDKCGYEFLNSPKHKAMEKRRIKQQINALKYSLRDLEE